MHVKLTQNKLGESSLESHFFFRKKLNNETKFIQPRLAIGPVDDFYEREADAVARNIMQPGYHQVQRKVSSLDVQRRCSQCEEEEKVQRKESNTGSGQTTPAIVSDVLNSPGASLSDDTRSFMENRIGYDFSKVRIHTDSLAAKSAQSINALAYTSGNNIVFNHGQYAPESERGKELLAHELTHVIQQTSSQSPVVQRRDFGFLGGKCCNRSPGVEWALVGNGAWMQLQPGECSPFSEDCDGITCGGGFYHTGGVAGTLLTTSVCRTPREDSWPFSERRWTPTVAASQAMSPTSRGASTDTPPGYQYD